MGAAGTLSGTEREARPPSSAPAEPSRQISPGRRGDLLREKGEIFKRPRSSKKGEEEEESGGMEMGEGSSLAHAQDEGDAADGRSPAAVRSKAKLEDREEGGGGS